MSVYRYSKFKILTDPQSKKKQELETGDVVMREYSDDHKVYSVMIVLETGTDQITSPEGEEQESPYFIGALIDGDEPQNGELLDFVRMTNLFDRDRSGALYLTSSDENSPYMDVVDGFAIENSMCFPQSGPGGSRETGECEYTSCGDAYLTGEYTESKEGVSRIYRITRNNRSLSGNDVVGFEQVITRKVRNPQRIVIGYKARASHKIKDCRISFGYADGTEIDGTDTVNITTEWEYKLSIITVDYPEQYTRRLLMDLTEHLSEDDWCEIAELNIVLLSDLVNMSNGTQVRIGKIRGVADPVFGLMDGYGAYIQNLYATRNVSIAGTLTAGDESGFSSSFYVGKIHKNCLINSIGGNFLTSVDVVDSGVLPTGIGKVFKFKAAKTRLLCQTSQWLERHNEKRYCFSFWLKTETVCDVSLIMSGTVLKTIHLEEPDKWHRYSVVFTTHFTGDDLIIEFETLPDTLLFCSGQLESGKKATLYQATDMVLNETDSYGCWFNEGGIGGTIQNPLLRLNKDGSISSSNGSFIIHPDGSGEFAFGKLAWTEDDIRLKDMVVHWEDLDPKAQENLMPVQLEIVSDQGFVIKNEGEDIVVKAMLYRNGEEVDPTGTDYQYFWKLLDSSGNNAIETYTGKFITVLKYEVSEKGSLICEVSK